MKVLYVAKEWLAEQRERKNRRTYERYERITESILIPELGEEEIEELTAEKIEKCLGGVKDGGDLQTGGSVSNRTVNLYRAVLSGIFNYAEKQGYITGNPVADVKPYSVKGIKYETFTAEEVAQLTEEINKKPERYIVYLLALKAGLLMSEAAALETRSIDLAARMLRVERVVYYVKNDRGKRELQIKKLSGDQYRMLPLTEDLTELLKEIFAAAPERRYVAENRDGGMSNPRVLQNTFSLMQKRCGIKPKGFETLRRTYVAEMLKKGVEYETLMRLLGLKKSSYTKARFLKLTKELVTDKD